MAKKKRPPRRTVSRLLPPRFLAELGEAEALMRKKNWAEARDVLESLAQRYPNRVEVLNHLLIVCYEQQDSRGYQVWGERLFTLTPDDPELASGLAGAYLLNGRLVLGWRAYRRFLERWPDHERAADARQLVSGLDAKMQEITEELGVPGNEGLDLAVMHEEVQAFLEQGQYSQARMRAEQFLRRLPTFAPVLNNLSQIYFLEGNIDQAIATAQRVLAFAPDNYHALSNLSRFLCLGGRIEEARQTAERLTAFSSAEADVWIKKAEALSYLGDDQGVLEAFRGAERAGHLRDALVDPLLYHLAAVAALRVGQETEARRHWRQALKLSPGFALVEENLRDLRQPVGKRHAPWAFELGNWITQKAMQDLRLDIEPLARRGRDEMLTQGVQRYLRQHPEIASLVPLLLDRGDPHGREFALRLASMAKTPDMLAALRDFALSQRGPDELRHQASSVVSEAGLLPAEPVRMWLEGEWREIIPLGFEVHDEPLQAHTPTVEEWVREATMLLREGKAKQAEQLLLKAREAEPEAPDILNNLAAAYGFQGRVEQADALTHHLYQQYPDYLFARTNMVQLALREGKIEQAEALLAPLRTRRRFHFSEFAAFCSAQIDLLLAQNKLEGARSWLDIWTKVDPDHPLLAHWRQRLARADKPRSLRRIFRGRV